jgi:hypothetical protein
MGYASEHTYFNKVKHWENKINLNSKRPESIKKFLASLFIANNWSICFSVDLPVLIKNKVFRQKNQLHYHHQHHHHNYQQKLRSLQACSGPIVFTPGRKTFHILPSYWFAVQRTWPQTTAFYSTNTIQPITFNSLYFPLNFCIPNSYKEDMFYVAKCALLPKVLCFSLCTSHLSLPDINAGTATTRILARS